MSCRSSFNQSSVETGKRAQMWDGEGWELSGVSETRSCPETQLLWGFYAGIPCAMQYRGHPLGEKKWSFKAAAGAGCFFPLAPTAAQSPFPTSRGPEVMLPGGASSSSLHPAPSTEEKKKSAKAKHRLAWQQSPRLTKAIKNCL